MENSKYDDMPTGMTEHSGSEGPDLDRISLNSCTEDETVPSFITESQLPTKVSSPTDWHRVMSCSLN